MVTRSASISDTGLILASSSQTRRQVLESAGIMFHVKHSDVDEVDLRAEWVKASAPLSPEVVAGRLALAKARAVSRASPKALVIGADQVLAFDGVLYSKPAGVSDAHAQLLSLRGKTHQLFSAVTLVRDGRELWSHVDRADLTMRHFSEKFLDSYLAAAGPDLCASVGAYHIESRGIQLFSKIEGDYFTILGLPLLPLAAALRAQGVLVE